MGAASEEIERLQLSEESPAAVKRYVYTDAWVSYLVRKLGDSETHREILGRDPEPLP